MIKTLQPAIRPGSPMFSSGPCTKHPGWSLHLLDTTHLGRSHRAKGAKAEIARAINRTRELLAIPDDYRIGIVPASDTGAFEMAMWSLLGPRGVDILSWESFGSGWVSDAVMQLKIPDIRVMNAEYGKLPDLAASNPNRDCVFVWNGTTSGVRVPDADWISPHREGLTLCDATSAVFAQDLDWDKLDAVTFSWQKVLGGEAQHGMLILSPRAVERLETHTPAWPLPKVFRLVKDGKLDEAIFSGSTINTPSMLCISDYHSALDWAEASGGLAGLMARANANAGVICEWVSRTPWINFLSDDPRLRSNTSVCLRFSAPEIGSLDDARQSIFAKSIVSILESEGVAYDIGAYRDAPPGLRIWCGSTVESDDLKALTSWIDWAYPVALTQIFDET